MTKLKGSWKKATEDRQAVKYPRFLEFRELGLYSARSEEGGIHPVWDAGTWEIISPSTVRISTSNDAEIVYKFTIKEDKLVFTDPEKISILYVRDRD